MKLRRRTPAPSTLNTLQLTDDEVLALAVFLDNRVPVPPSAWWRSMPAALKSAHEKIARLGDDVINADRATRTVEGSR
jgi:hypothetical protein